MRKTKALVAPLTVLSGLLGSASVSLAAPNLDVALGVDAEYHDNAALVSSDEQSDLAWVAHAQVDFDKPDGALLAKVGYLVERRDYMDDVEEDSTRVDGSSLLTWLALPNLLDFSLSHQISDQLQDRREADTPNNRERRSIISVAANGYGHLSRVDTIILSPRFTDVAFESSDTSDSQHAAFDLTWQHALSRVSRISLTGTHEQVRFDDENDDYDANRVMLSYSAQLSRLSYSVGGGFNAVERDVGDDVNGYTARITADYTDDNYSWGAAAVRQLTDTSIGLSGFETSISNFRAVDGNISEFDIVESTQIDLFGRRKVSATSQINAGVGYIRQDYQDTPRDENSWYVQAGYAYSVNPRWTLGLNARYENSDFPDDIAGREQKDKQLDLSVNYLHSERLKARFGIGREERDANISTESYTDNFMIVGVTYLLY